MVVWKSQFFDICGRQLVNPLLYWLIGEGQSIVRGRGREEWLCPLMNFSLVFTGFSGIWIRLNDSASAVEETECSVLKMQSGVSAGPVESVVSVRDCFATYALRQFPAFLRHSEYRTQGHRARAKMASGCHLPDYWVILCTKKPLEHVFSHSISSLCLFYHVPSLCLSCNLNRLPFFSGIF